MPKHPYMQLNSLCNCSATLDLLCIINAVVFSNRILVHSDLSGLLCIINAVVFSNRILVLSDLGIILNDFSLRVFLI